MEESKTGRFHPKPRKQRTLIEQWTDQPSQRFSFTSRNNRKGINLQQTYSKYHCHQCFNSCYLDNSKIWASFTERCEAVNTHLNDKLNYRIKHPQSLIWNCPHLLFLRTKFSNHLLSFYWKQTVVIIK